MVRTSFVQRRVRRGRTLKAILDPIVVAQAHREPPSPGRPASGGYDDTRRNRLSAIENSNSDLFWWRCRVARCPIRGNAIRTQMGGTRGSPRDLAPASSRRHPNGHMGPFSRLRRSPDFQHFVDYGIARTSLDRRSMPPVTALMRRVRMDVEVALSWATAGKYARNIGRIDLL